MGLAVMPDFPARERPDEENWVGDKKTLRGV